MSEVLQANIFFFIASVATVVFCIFVCFILFHVLKIVRSLRAIIERIEAGSESIAEDVAFARSWMKGGVARLFGLFGASTRSTKKHKVRDDEDED